MNWLTGWLTRTKRKQVGAARLQCQPMRKPTRAPLLSFDAQGPALYESDGLLLTAPDATGTSVCWPTVRGRRCHCF